MERLTTQVDRLRKAAGAGAQPHRQQRDAGTRVRASEVSQALRKVSMERKKLRASERAREKAERDALDKTAECERLRHKLEQVLKRRRPHNHPQKHRNKQDRRIVVDRVEKETRREKSGAQAEQPTRLPARLPTADDPDYDIHGRKSEALADALADAQEWDARVALAYKIVNKPEPEQHTETAARVQPKKNSRAKMQRKQEHSLTLPSLSRQQRQDESSVLEEPSEARRRVEYDDQREDGIDNGGMFHQRNHERRLEEAYDRLRNRQHQRLHQAGQHRNDLAKTF